MALLSALTILAMRIEFVAAAADRAGRYLVKFSDGTQMDIDDVIFSLYVPLDPTYDGIMTLYSLPIEGLEAYRSGAVTENHKS